METWPQLQIKNRKSGEKKKYRLDQSHAIIGRDPSNFIVLDTRTVSRRHAEIVKEGTQYYLRDLKSNNGTLLNEKKLTPEEKTILKSGDTLQIEDYDVVFQIPNASEVEDPYEITNTDILEIKMVKKLLKAIDRESAPALEVLEGPQAGERFVLEGKKQEIVVGRDAAAEFRIDSEVISRKHARIVKKFETVKIIDLGSKNGLFVNKEKVKEKTLRDGDVIHLGTLAIGFRNPQELSSELFPEKPPAPRPPPPTEKKKSPARSSEPKEAGRATRRRQEKLVQASAPPEEEAFSPPPEEEPAARTGPSFIEIGMILLGLAVLAGSIWGIIRLLK